MNREFTFSTRSSICPRPTCSPVSWTSSAIRRNTRRRRPAWRAESCCCRSSPCSRMCAMPSIGCTFTANWSQRPSKISSSTSRKINACLSWASSSRFSRTFPHNIFHNAGAGQNSPVRVQSLPSHEQRILVHQQNHDVLVRLSAWPAA